MFAHWHPEFWPYIIFDGTCHKTQSQTNLHPSKLHASKCCAKNNLNVALVLILCRVCQKYRVEKMLHPQKHKILTEVNGESSLFFIWRAIKNKTAQDYSTALKVLPCVLNFYWLQKLVELHPSKKIGSKKAVRYWGPMATSIRLIQYSLLGIIYALLDILSMLDML